MTFFDIAKPLAERGIPQIRLRPKTKIAFETDWPTRATTDLGILQTQSEEMPDANAASVAQAKIGGFWIFEIDKANLHKEIEQQTGQKFPTTFVVRSSPGRGHFFFKQNAASIEMGNAQGKDDAGKESWSARVDSRYVVSAGSEHPTSGRKYEVISDAEIVEAPEWLIQWCSAQKTEDRKAPITASVDGPKILRGSHDTVLTSIAGKLRQDGLEEEAIYNALVEVCEKRCENYGSDYREMTRKIAHSVCRYEIKESPVPLIGGVPAGSSQKATVTPQEEIEIPNVKAVAYPVWPKWVMSGTSLYDGLVKPICDKNSRYPEFVWLPAVVLMLNYLALKVSVEGKQLIPSFFMVSIGRKGRVIKSSSVRDAQEYFRTAGLLQSGGSSRTAEGKTLVWTPGSTEGLGMEMSRTNCKNAVAFYDELSMLTKKAGIESSTLIPNLLTMYESDKFSNTIKSRKESFNFDAMSYCASLIACTTDKNFHQNWSRMAGDSSGLDERFFFLYQPETLIPLTPYKFVNTTLAAVETRKRIDKAVQQKTYVISDETQLEEKINRLGNRVEIRAEKLALYFAVDLGREEIDEECVERALAICEYEVAVKKYLSTFEATTREGGLQMEIIQLLQRNGGKILIRDLNRQMHPERHGTFVWSQVYNGLIKNGWTVESGAGTKGDPKQLILMRVPESEDE